MNENAFIFVHRSRSLNIEFILYRGTVCSEHYKITCQIIINNGGGKSFESKKLGFEHACRMCARGGRRGYGVTDGWQ
jgi:hypothetical protein